VLAIPGLDSGFLYNQLSNAGSDCGWFLGFKPAIPRNQVHLCRLKPINPAAPVRLVSLQAPELDTRFLQNHVASCGSDWGDLWDQRQLEDGIGSFSPRCLFIMLQAEIVCWRSKNAMAECSIIVMPILHLIARDYWAQCQPYDGIGFFPPHILFMKSQC